MKRFILLLIFSTSHLVLFSQTVKLPGDTEINKLSDNVYIYTSWADVGKWGRVGSNGLIIIDSGKAFMVDTPMHENQAVELVKWIESDLGVKLTGFVPGHWHDDCVGGMKWLKSHGVHTYAGERTNAILKSKGMPTAEESFKDSLIISISDIPIECYYLGGGHSTDNIVVWLPSERILFGGCMLKACNENGIGNTSDASPLSEWRETVEKLGRRFTNAIIVVPGHGKHAGKEIFDHTVSVVEKNISAQK